MPKRLNLRISIFAMLLFLGSACRTVVSPPPPITSPTALPSTPTLAPPATETAVPTTTAAAQPTNTVVPPTLVPTPTAVPPFVLAAELKAFVEAGMAGLSPDGLDGFGGVTVLPAAVDPPLWIVHTFGFRSFNPLQNHFVAIYTRAGADWQELSRLELEAPDILFEESGRLVDLADGRLWLEIQSGAGAHGSCYDLLRYDGFTLSDEIQNCHSSFASQGVNDLNQDGVPDLVLNFTDDYVFCYACGVRYPNFQVFTWNGGTWEEISFTRLPEDHPAAGIHNRVVELAQAGLWQEAAIEIGLSSYQDETTDWNQTLINLYVDTLRSQAENSTYPLLGHLFYGDYGSALNVLRPYAPAELFDPNGPLIAGTAAEGWNEPLADWINLVTSAVLEINAHEAAAHFLRGWAAYLVDPGDPTALSDLRSAAGLDPSDPLFSQSLAYLGGG